MNITINDDEVQRLLRQLESATPLKAGMKAMAGYLRGKMSIYPATLGNRPGQPFVSDRQRRYFFAALRRGEITVPYVRTGNLAKKWGQADADGGLTQVVGNTAGYAPYVVGIRSQSAYMAGLGWKSMSEVMEAETEAAMTTFTVAFRQSMGVGR